MSQTSAPEYVWLGSFRFLLAVLVFCAHAGDIGNTHIELIRPGALGVFLFFAVSAYVIVAAQETYYRGRNLAFLTNRLLRIFPMFWICYGITLAAMMVMGVERLGGGSAPNIDFPSGTRALVLGLTILGGMFDSSALGPSPAAWSIITELLFYLAAAAVPILAGRWLGARHAMWLAGLMALAAAAAVLLTDRSTSIFGMLTFSPFFVAGGAQWYVRHGQGGWAAKLLLGLGLAGCVVFLLAADTYLPHTFDQISPLRRNNLIAFALLYALFTGCTRLRLRSPGLTRVDRSVGDLTYPLYLCHVPILALLWTHPWGSPGPLAFLASLAVCIAFAAVLNHVTERPLSVVRDHFRGSALQR